MINSISSANRTILKCFLYKNTKSFNLTLLGNVSHRIIDSYTDNKWLIKE